MVQYTFAWARPRRDNAQLEGRVPAKRVTIPVNLLQDARLDARTGHDLRIITYHTVWFILRSQLPYPAPHPRRLAHELHYRTHLGSSRKVELSTESM